MGAILLQGGTLAPGSSAGTLSGDSLDWQSGVLLFELGADSAESDYLELAGIPTGSANPLLFTFLNSGRQPKSALRRINPIGTRQAMVGRRLIPHQAQSRSVPP